jgi:hypothetical protein
MSLNWLAVFQFNVSLNSVCLLSLNLLSVSQFTVSLILLCIILCLPVHRLILCLNSLFLVLLSVSYSTRRSFDLFTINNSKDTQVTDFRSNR